jgi:hypothetical protein
MSREEAAFALALVMLGVAVVRVLGRRRALPAPASPAAAPEEPVCRARGCSAPATRPLPELRPWRPLGAILPRWLVETDDDGDAALCRAHHGALEAALAARAADEAAATETHLATRHRDLVAWASGQLCRDHGIAPPAARPAPRPTAESEPATSVE